MSGWLPVVAGAGLAFGSEDILAPVSRGHWYHQVVSERAARSHGWSPAAARELGWNALGADLYSYHPVWRFQGGLHRLRGRRAAAPALRSVHFDDLPDPRAVDETWRRITGGAVAGLRWAQERDDVGAARHLIGVALHAIQDFYSHSTWIDDPARRDTTWLESHGWPGELVASAEKDLQTGGFEDEQSEHVHGRTGFTWQALTRLPDMVLERIPGAPPVVPPRGLRHAGRPGINLDSRWQAPRGAETRGLGLSGDDAFDLAITLAERETKVFLAGLATTTSSEFWRRLAEADETDWTEQYDDRLRRPYSFITAGHYPPHGTRASEDWFLRIDVTGEATAAFVQHAGRTLQRWRLAGHRTVTLGPVPLDATVLELHGDLELARVHAFRRFPRPMVLALGSGPVRSVAEHDLAVIVDRHGHRR